MHNAIANKLKRNDEHLQSVVTSSNPKILAVIRGLHANGIELKIMTAFKNAMFESDKVTDNHMLPMEEFERIRLYETQNRLDSVKEKLVD